MSTNFHRAVTLLLGAAALTLSGCSFGPSPISVPQLSPEQVTETVFSTYDYNKDGLLSTEELGGCPGMRGDFRKVDTNKDKRISKEELSARFEMWVTGGIGASRLNCRVTKKGRPVEGAVVKLVPEGFFGGLIQPAEGTTDRTGIAHMAMDSANLPSDMGSFRVVQQGYYKAEITHPSISIPSEYNTDTKLGVAASFESGGSLVSFKL